MANLSNRNFRVNEVEQKANFSSVIRAANYDPKFYLNDKDTPPEDTELLGGNPPVAESSWASRFFFLPNLLCSSLVASVGTHTRYNANPWNYDVSHQIRRGRNSIRYGYPNDPYGVVWTETLDDYKMASYGVTIDPQLVPLTPVAIDAIAIGNIDDSWPDEPSYRFWNGSELTISTYHSTTMNDPPPVDVYRDSRGPFQIFEFCHPAFFSVYETRGITSISGQQFTCRDYQYWQGVNPLFLRNSLGAQHSNYYSYSTTGWGPFYTCAYQSNLSPLCCYVLRPSTGQIVGWLFADSFTASKGAVNSPTSPGNLPSGITEEETNTLIYFASYSDVTGMQDGDLIVWEWWSFPTGNVWMMNPDAQTTRPMVKSPVNHIRTHFGGGQAGQPLTKSMQTGLPNWAPAWRTSINAMTGYRPR